MFILKYPVTCPSPTHQDKRKGIVTLTIQLSVGQVINSPSYLDENMPSVSSLRLSKCPLAVSFVRPGAKTLSIELQPIKRHLTRTPFDSMPVPAPGPPICAH
jgi:hypothetical protein